MPRNTKTAVATAIFTLSAIYITVIELGGGPWAKLEKRQQICLARAVYHEARGELQLGRLAVAATVLRRSKDKRWPNNLCDVVYQPSQFTWAHDGKNDVMTSTDAKAQSFKDASYVYNHWILLQWIWRFDHFYSGNTPNWAKKMPVSVSIGAHTFLISSFR